MAKPGSSTQFHSWTSAPVLDFVVGQPKNVDLRQYVKNIHKATLTYSVASGGALPSGVTQNLGAGSYLVSWSGTGVGGVYGPYTFNATNVNTGYNVASPPSNINITALQTDTPSAPVNVSATTLTSSSIRVSWVAGSGGSTITEYRVERASGAGGPWTQITFVNGSTFSYDNINLSAGTTYYYRIIAYDGVAVSAPSAVVSAMTGAATAPSTPINLFAIGETSSTIALTWAPGSGGSTPDNYKVYRSETGAYGPESFTPIASPTLPEYDDTPLPANTTRYYRVSAVANGLESTKTGIVSAMTLGVEAPATPTGVAVTVVSPSELQVSWTPGVGGSAVTEFHIYRASTGTGSYSQIDTDSASPYNNTGLLAGTTYFYKVAAFDGTTESTLSTEIVSGTTQTVAPGTPTNVTVTTLSGTSLRVAWTASSSGATPDGFKIYRSSDGVTYGSPATDTASPYDSTGLSYGTRYWYRVSATAGASESQLSVAESGTTYTQVPTPPQGLTASALSTTTIRLSWQAPLALGTPPVTYTVYRSDTGVLGTFASIASGLTALSYDDDSLTAGVTKYYRVSAVDNDGDEGTKTATVSAQTITASLPPVPSNVTATAISQTGIRIAWSFTVGAGETTPESFKIYRSATSGGTYNHVGSSSMSPFDNTTELVSNTTYYYKVRSVDAQLAESNLSLTASATTWAAPSTGTWPTQTPSYVAVAPNLAGYGCDTLAGYGTSAYGQACLIYRVTTLADGTGTGTLRNALTASGTTPRVIIFDIGGISSLTSGIINTANSHITLAGCSAPGKGIMLRDGHIRFRGSDVYVNHMHFRTGDQTSRGGEAVASGTRDGVQYLGNAGAIENFVLDHCSSSWSVDENLDLSGTASNITIAYCIFAEGLDNTEHGLGILIGNESVDNVMFIGNLIMSNIQRFPLSRTPHLKFVNNVAYNWRDNATDLQSSINVTNNSINDIIGNVYGKGPLNSGMQPVYLRGTESTGIRSGPKTKLYLSDNRVGASAASATLPADQWGNTMIRIGSGRSSAIWDGTDGKNRVNTAQLSIDGLVAASSADVFELVTHGSGAFPLNRDAVDTRLINEIETNSGARLKTSVLNAGDWPAYTTTGGAGYWNGGDDPIPDGVSGRPSPTQLEGNGLTRIRNWVDRRKAEKEP